jgi:hypothetical protein
MNRDGKYPLIRTRGYLFGQRRLNKKTVGVSFSRTIPLKGRTIKIEEEE